MGLWKMNQAGKKAVKYPILNEKKGENPDFLTLGDYGSLAIPYLCYENRGLASW